jgi:hypothetical protein
MANEATGTDRVHIRWLVRDKATDEYLGRQANWVDYRYAACFTTAEEAATAAIRDVGPGRFDTAEFVEEKTVCKSGPDLSAVMPPPTSAAIVPSSWLGLGGWDARTLLATRRLVERRAVDPADLPAVAEIWSQVTGRQPIAIGPR